MQESFTQTNCHRVRFSYCIDYGCLFGLYAIAYPLDASPISVGECSVEFFPGKNLELRSPLDCHCHITLVFDFAFGHSSLSLEVNFHQFYIRHLKSLQLPIENCCVKTDRVDG